MRPISVYKYTCPQMACSLSAVNSKTPGHVMPYSMKTSSVIPAHGREACLRTASFSQRSTLYRIPGRKFPLACLPMHDDPGMSCLHTHSVQEILTYDG
jgi:hypothetical protein